MATAGPSQKRRPSNLKGKKNALLNLKNAKKIGEKQAIKTLEDQALNFVPPPDLKTFSSLPISEQTKRGLKKAFFVDMTDIQKDSIPVSLQCKDVLGAARTGSGKTLSFLVPALEILYRRKWGPSDGLGALIISPTRELAVQIFEVLRSIGGYHSFSAGLVIGGKNVKDERERLSRMNILVATPGRLLQHMDQTFGFECDNLQLLVLDEADRILDMGFAKTLAALLGHLPKSRQTLLFSATQTQSVADLARLSLKNPVAIGVNPSEESSAVNTATPDNLEQHYLVCSLDQKLSILWGFIRTHLQSKILVFMSSTKQVRFVFETFCKMHPGMPLIHLHGKQKQSARLAMYDKFTTSKNAVLFATDIAARGLDFPSVEWVLQLDAPEDADTYIHRVGRTARYESKGKGLLFLMPSEEEGMLAALKQKHIEVSKIKIRANKSQSIQNQLQSLAFQDPEIKYLGQKAFVSYLRSIYLHKDKSIFKLSELPVDAFAESLGLPGTPRIKFLGKDAARQKKNANKDVANLNNSQKVIANPEDHSDSSSSSEEEDEEEVKEAGKKDLAKVRTKYDRMFERKNQNILSEHYARLVDHTEGGDDGDDGDFITLKRADHELDDATLNLSEIQLNNLSRRKMKLGLAKKQLILNAPTKKKLVFDDAGEGHEAYEVAPADDYVKEKGGIEGVMAEGLKYAEGQLGVMKKADTLDKEEARMKKKEKKRKRKDRERDEADGVVGPVVADNDDDGYVSPDFDLPSGSEDEADFYTAPPPSKRQRQIQPQDTIEDDEMLALQLLRRS